MAYILSCTLPTLNAFLKGPRKCFNKSMISVFFFCVSKGIACVGLMQQIFTKQLVAFCELASCRFFKTRPLLVREPLLRFRSPLGALGIAGEFGIIDVLDTTGAVGTLDLFMISPLLDVLLQLPSVISIFRFSFSSLL